jgi:DNA-binding response OmpR family regulator
MSSTLTPRRKKSGPPDDNLEVVFIGEDLGLAELYRLKLELDGYWVTVFSSIDDGLEHIRTRLPDLVFVDLGPGSRRKSECLEPLRSDARFAELPIVLLARGDIQAVEPESLQLGGRDFLVRVDAVPGEDFWKDATDGPPRQTL